MNRPLWTSVWFAAFVAVAMMGLAVLALRVAIHFARFDVDPLVRQKPDNLKAVLCLMASMLLVIGSRGLGGFASAVLGSVCHGVLHRAHCPVAVVREAWRRS